MHEFWTAVQGITALAALLVAVVVAVWQGYTHSENVKHQLFEKRIRVYECFERVLKEIRLGRRITATDLSELRPTQLYRLWRCGSI